MIIELIISLLLWTTILIPVNSYIVNFSDLLPYKTINKIYTETIFDVTKLAQESLMSRPDLSVDLLGQEFSSSSIKSYNLIKEYIPVKSTSTMTTGIISDGQNIFVTLNSASTTDFDLIAYNYKDISKPLDMLDSGPGLVGEIYIGKNLFVLNSSVNSSMQKFKFDNVKNKLNKISDYKIPWSSSANPVYPTKISAIYPHLFIGLKKNINEELLSIDLNKIDNDLQNAIDKKWEFDSSIQAIWPMYDKYLHLIISTAKEPELNDLCLNCNFGLNYSSSSESLLYGPTTNNSVISTLDLPGSLGNVKSLLSTEGKIFVGRSSGNNELFKINIERDYSSSTKYKNIYNVENAIDIDGGVYSMLFANSKIFLVEDKSNSKIQIRSFDDLSKIIHVIDTNLSISDMEAVGSDIFGVGFESIIKGTSTIVSTKPVIFEIKPSN